MELFIEKGGIFIWPLLFFTIVCFAAILERAIYWLYQFSKIKKNEREELINEQASLKNYISRDQVVNLGIDFLSNKRFNSYEVESLLGEQTMSRLKNLRLLDVITTAGPSLGILGTIWGMIQSFNLIGEVEILDPKVAMSGIAEAFISTGAGLILSLIALLAYNYFSSLAEKEQAKARIFFNQIRAKI